MIYKKEIAMKGFLVLVIVSMLTVCLMAGCGGGVKTYIDAGKTIITGVDREFIIALDSNPTTGYRWQESHEVSMLSLVEDIYEPDEKAEGLVGAGGTQYYCFKALKEGSTEINLVYKRSWEEETARERVFKVNIK